MPANRLEAEVAAALQTVESMLSAYREFSSAVKIGESQWAFYDEIVDYVNMRVETASTIALLTREERIADALGLARSLLEHVVLLRLMIRGRQHIRVEEPSRRSGAEWKEALRKAQDELSELHAKGEALTCLRVIENPRRSKQLVWIFEGPVIDDEPDLVVPIHYFHFKDFRPEQHRLKDDGSLDWFPRNYEGLKTLRKAKARHKSEAAFRYDHYLSWGAMLGFLKLNELADAAEIERLEGHYTFLGQFLHPTHEAARRLHEQDNFHMGGTRVGLEQRYDRVAVLLAALYSVWLVRAALEEVADMYDSAPARYVKSAPTQSLRKWIELVPERFSYFWFVSNRAPLWDRFEHAVRVSPDASGGYADLPDEGIKFEWNTYERLRKALVGSYVPVTGMRYNAPF